ncbi:MAG TPA: preprotein translocase subunit SecG [Atribacteraceae bacterium]|nr:preprotein translocase subunit SecG [Atribacteraceae bacterium]
MANWMIVQVLVSIGVILVVIFQPRKAGLGGGIFGGSTRADKSSKFKNLSILGKLTVLFSTVFMILSLVFAFFLV